MQVASTTAGSRDGTARSTIARCLQLRPANGLPAFQPSRPEPHPGGLTLLNSNPRPLVAPLDPSRCECHRLRQSGPTSQHTPSLIESRPTTFRPPLPIATFAPNSFLARPLPDPRTSRTDSTLSDVLNATLLDLASSSRHSFDLSLRDRSDPLTVPAPASTSTHPPHPP